eukprot:symbB.v1.2.041775.t1/scaffold8626.1/size5573/1
MDDDNLCPIYSSDTRLMLCWIALLTSSHFFMNVRWCYLIPCEIAGILGYIFCAVLGSPEGIFNVPMNLALFVGITLLACMAKRQLEHHERHSMLQLISERRWVTLRPEKLTSAARSEALLASPRHNEIPKQR